ncbi:MAG: UDP-N-acetylmuramate--L-alanine ligase [Acidobacteriota bacterium]
MSEHSYPRFRRIHFVGIGGIGMSGIAELLANLGYAVSGSDLNETAVTRRLVEHGATVFKGHDASQVEGTDVVVVSSAVTDANPEVRRARELAIPVIPRAEMLAELMRLKYGIAVAGSHGKTTTTSLVAAVVHGAGLDPTVVVGGRLAALGTNALLGHGRFLVCEADESDGSFLKLSPTIAVVTNVDLEHLEAYADDVAQLETAFVDFCNAVPFYGAAIVCQDDPRLRALLPRIERRVVTYGESAGAELSLRDLTIADGKTCFTAFHRGDELGRIELGSPGRHFALNALAALAVALELDLPFEEAARSLAGFQGVDRRLSHRGEVDGVTVIDDYGHHPTEIAVTLEALRNGHSPRRLIAIFQPHRYSRVQRLLEDFGGCFHHADHVITCPVHAAGEAPIEGVDSEALAESLGRHGHRDVVLAESVDDAVRQALELASEGDLVVTLGAGDVTRAADAIVAGLKDRAGESS